MFRILYIAIVFSFTAISVATDIKPSDIQFKRQAVRRLVFDKADAIPLSTFNPAEIVDLELEYPTINTTSSHESNWSLEAGNAIISSDKISESARWIGGFNPFATYDVSFARDQIGSGKAGVSLSSPDSQTQIAVLAGFKNGECTAIHWLAKIEGEDRQIRNVDLETPVKGAFTLRVQLLGTGLNIFIEQQGINRVVYTREFSKMIDLRKSEHIRAFEYRLVTKVSPGDQIVISKASSSLTTGAGQADIRAITYEDGSAFFDRGRLWFTITVRGRLLPHPLQGVFSLNPSVFDPRFEGIIVFDRDDGLLRNEVASHIFYDRKTNQWSGITTGFSAYGDPDKKIPKQLWAVTSKRDPRFGYSVMKASPIVVPNAAEDPHVIYDADAKKWRMLVCSEGGAGFPATLYEADQWNGPYEMIAGPAKVNGTGCLLQKIGSKYYAMFGSADRKFYVYSYPELEPLDTLDMIRPPWNTESNTRCWPNVIPLPDGYPAPYIALSMDRANYPGLKGWTYGALYFYHGHPKTGKRANYEYK